ncbi:MAG: hypothetical protein M5R36_27350 [Deltaproteobacteria bacterium]|nr:hypothetical protein [Deltaproteobacteria bacterium]
MRYAKRGRPAGRLFSSYDRVHLRFGFRLSRRALRKLTPDAGVYMDMARSLARGEGFRLSVNLYQDWIGASRTSVPYQQPIAPLMFSPVAGGPHAVSAAIIVNGFLTVAAMLGFFAAFARFLPSWKAALALLPMAVSPAAYIVVSAPLAEPSSLVLIAWGFFFLFRARPRMAAAGLLMGLSVLARASNLFRVVGLATAVALSLGRAGWKHAAVFSMTALAPFVVFDVFGRVFLGTGYPGYGLASKVYLMTRDYGGAIYHAAAPSLTFGGQIGGAVLWKMLVLNSTAHLAGMARSTGWIYFLPALAAFFVRLFADHQIHRWLSAFAYSQFFALGFIYHFIGHLEVERYSLVPLALLPAVALMAEQRLDASWGRPAHRRLAVAAIVLLTCVWSGSRTIGLVAEDRRQYLDPDARRTYFNEPSA